jgi:UDP-GlcNAc:undecaprenyl-phosphate GlcNAc-1-phosphate transferase
LNLNIVLLFSIVFIAGASFLALENRIMRFLKQKNLTRQNYAGNQVLSSGGLLLLIPCLLASIPSFMLNPSPVMPLYVTMMPTLTFCGMLDDLLGDSSSRGLAEHFGTFLKGNFSTGIMKALTGSMIGLLLAWLRYSGPFLMILDTLVFALAVNFINLLDLRPGRAIKGFGFMIILMTVLRGFSEIQYILPVLTALVFYARGEMREIYMLGDTGANLIGGILGFYVILTLTPVMKGMLFVLFLSLHIFAEFHSLSKKIEGIPILRKIDMLGRKQSER